MSDAAPRTHALVTGGGTSGHVLPALAILDRLVARGHAKEAMHYVGTTRGVETRLLPPTGYPHTLLDVGGLQRSIAPHDLRRNLLFLPKLVRATSRARRLLRELRPRVVVNVGGYASMPGTFAALLTRTPVVVVSYDLRPGLASKVSARFAAVSATAFEGSRLRRARLVGAPIRPEIIGVDRSSGRDAARAALGLPADRFVVAVFGGSLGAKALNDAVAALVEACAARADLCVYHVVGERWRTAAPPGRSGDDGIMYRVIGYEDRMPLLYAAADLMVTRAGASTIAEIAATGTPAIVVPWPGAAENHQLDNARTLSDRGAALLVEERDLDGARLVEIVEALMADSERLRRLATAAAEAGALHRSDSLIELIDDVARRG
jgi:UDP-N-acetylglucosamine--N-acetylmuramyl-(pentapeptide) pyrophosphoryl-undecaprenol N-acetylglucosamine transferase